MEKLKLLIEELISLLKQFFKDTTPAPVPEPVPEQTKQEEKPMTRNMAVLLKAASQLGVKEIPGEKSNPQIVEYHKYSTVKNLFGFADSVPWCASFIAWCLEKSGMESTNKQLARSYEKWGVSVKNSPVPGDIVTFWRNSLKSGYGHVGFFLKSTPKGVYILGGNQNDSVNVSLFSTAKMTDIRRSSKAGKYTQNEIEDLRQVAEKIIAGEDVGVSGRLT
jgi:uncharacterized protein (TIGR02594 family)